MGHWLGISAVYLWVCATNIGSFAYVFPPELINHEPLPEPVTEDTTSLCEPEGVYTKPDPVFCDHYMSCIYGQLNQMECPDGYGFQPSRGCKPIHLVDCGNRTQLQPPKGSGACPRLNGIYPDQRGCSHYIRCTNGKSVSETCKDRSVFDDESKSCRNPTLEEYSRCFLQDSKPTNYNSLSNQQISATQPFPNQQGPTTDYPPANQQVKPNYNVLAYQQQVPPTYNPINELASTTFKPTAPITQQVPTNYNIFTNQVEPTTYDHQIPLNTMPPANQQRPNIYNPSFSNQMVPTSYNLPTTGYPVSQYAQTPQYASYQSGVTSSTSGFVCPSTNFFAFGDHTRYEYPGNCHLFYICLRDGSVKLGGCQAPTAYDPKSQVCVAMKAIRNCT